LIPSPSPWANFRESSSGINDRIKELEDLANDTLEQSKALGSEATEEWAAMEAC